MQLSRVFGLDETHSAKRKAHSAIWRDKRERREKRTRSWVIGKGQWVAGRKQLAAGRRQPFDKLRTSRQRAEIRDQKSEVRGQKQLVMYNV